MDVHSQLQSDQLPDATGGSAERASTLPIGSEARETIWGQSIGNIGIGASLPNAVDPDQLSAEERIRTICAILAKGLIRLQYRQSRDFSPENRENFLDLRAERSAHGRP